jgi:amino acid adenylation domain-containing protein
MAPVHRVKYIINNCQSKWLITSKERADHLIPDLSIDSSLGKVIVLGGDADPSTKGAKNVECFKWEAILLGEEKEASVTVPDTYPAYILHTSGSTGLPKGVAISHLNSLTFVKLAADFFGIRAEDRLCSHAPIQFDLSVFDIFVAVQSGSTIVLVPETLSLFPVTLAQFIEEAKISVWNSVASVLSFLAARGQLERFPYDSLRLVIFSGDILPVKYLRTMMTHMKRTRFFNVYGQTEANSSTFYEIKGVPNDNAWRIPIGKAFPNFEVFALNGKGEMIRSAGEEGELYVNGSTVAMGYWGDPGKTAESFVDDPRSYGFQRKIYKTGDLVKLDDHGDYIFLGRKDSQVKSRGYRIQLDEIEFILNSHEEVKQAVVIAIPDELIGNRIIGYISCREGFGLTEDEIHQYCSRFLPGYMVPEKISFIEKFPKTVTGKVDRKVLAELPLTLQ